MLKFKRSKEENDNRSIISNGDDESYFITSGLMLLFDMYRDRPVANKDLIIGLYHLVFNKRYENRDYISLYEYFSDAIFQTHSPTHYDIYNIAKELRDIEPENLKNIENRIKNKPQIGTGFKKRIHRKTSKSHKKKV
jgi:hypothetical protein